MVESEGILKRTARAGAALLALAALVPGCANSQPRQAGDDSDALGIHASDAVPTSVSPVAIKSDDGIDEAISSLTGEKTAADRHAPEVKQVRRSHLRFADEAAERKFLEKYQPWENEGNDLAVLRRVLADEIRRLQSINAALTARYEIDPAKNYRFDDQNNTIYLLPSVGPVHDGDKKEPDAKIHKTLKTEEDGVIFARHVRARQLSREIQMALAILIRRKDAQRNAHYLDLAREYSMSRDRSYEYDSAKRELFEIVPKPIR